MLTGLCLPLFLVALCLYLRLDHTTHDPGKHEQLVCQMKTMLMFLQIMSSTPSVMESVSDTVTQ